jgi:hypothetical protein
VQEFGIWARKVGTCVRFVRIRLSFCFSVIFGSGKKKKKIFSSGIFTLYVGGKM